ncbi:cardiolipin synthase ClsB [Aquincola sp. S2]|uniref:Cardiolipin synthase B n=1 Tax=Pseudaquabacterium terrae TaxID=2732868 RepID=A0ABX2EKD5_9BURK|nr:cardiolipin synthase ClsB [Aquabacterium terrae]NRF69061.1 cardiolipin synthase ClsB [Aquabacterium terrae]
MPPADHHRRYPTLPPAQVLRPALALRPVLSGGNRVRLLAGGDELFPAMCAAIAQARRQVWLATYIFHDDDAARCVANALAEAARRGVWVGVVVDGFGSKATLPSLRERLVPAGVQLVVFRPVDRWWRLLQPGQLRRLHQKLCVVDGHDAYVGGINLIDDRNDLNHGLCEAPRLDFAIELQGPLVASIEQSARAMWSRAALGADWRDELLTLARSAEPVARARRMASRLRILPPSTPHTVALAELPPVRAAFLVRDNLRQRRAIEHAYIEAISRARRRVEIMCPYFYPGRPFRRALQRAAARGVQVRLLLQGKPDYRFAALAAQVLYGELLDAGVRVFEYMPAFLHAKVAVVDDDWATVGSSNIDPLSLLLNLEANVIVRDMHFTGELALRFESAVLASREVLQPPVGPGWWSTLRRGFVAWTAYWFLRLAGMSGKY